MAYGVLVRLITCKISTNSLPKLSLTTFPPPEKRRGNRSAGWCTGGRVKYPGGFTSSWWYRGECFSRSTWCKVIGGDTASAPCRSDNWAGPHTKPLAGTQSAPAGLTIEQVLIRNPSKWSQIRIITGLSRPYLDNDNNGESLKKLIIHSLWMVGFEPTTQKAHCLSTTPFVKVLVGY